MEVVFAYKDDDYVFPEDYATLLGEDLRGYAAGTFDAGESRGYPE